MRLISKMAVGTAIVIGLGATSLNAAVYVVKPGDTLNSIVYKKLGFKSFKDSGIKSVPSGDFSKIYPGDHIEYKKKKKKKFVLKTKKVDLKKFCFKDNTSIHYRAEERCK